MAIEAGAAFVKTSTGFASHGATVADIHLLRQTVGPEMGVKAAGGIRTIEDALGLIDAGATRLGTSAGVALLEAFAAARLRKPPRPVRIRRFVSRIRWHEGVFWYACL